MNVALIESNLTGHRITYLHCYIDSFLSQGFEVHLYLPDLTEFQKKAGPNLHLHKYEEPKNKKYYIERFEWSLNLFNKWKTLNNFIKKSQGNTDLVFFLGLDSYRFGFGPMIHSRLKFLIPLVDKLVPFFLDRHFKFKWSGVSILPDFRIDQIFYSKNCLAIGILNEYFDFGDKTLNSKKLVLPDITDIDDGDETNELVTKILTKAKGRKIISILGSIDKRKSVFTLLDTAQLCTDKDYFFLIAGESRFDTHNELEIDRLKSSDHAGIENCYFHLARVEDGKEFNSLVKISDIVFASYLNFTYSSNVLTKIAYFRKPVIVSDNGIMALRVKKYNLGVCIKEGRVSEVLSAIDKLLNSFESEEALFQNYYSLNSEEKLKENLKYISDKF